MPNFNFSEAESLALTLYLTSQKKVPEQWPEFPEFGGITNWFGYGSDANQGKKLLSEMACITCHKIEETGNLLVSDLGNIGSKLNADWIKTYLAGPHFYSGKETGMPALFFKVSSDSTHFEEITDDPVDKINHITIYLSTLNMQENELKVKYEHALSKYEVSIEIGADIFRSQNCAACHRSAIQSSFPSAPNLSFEGERVNPDWLKSFLDKPHLIRSFGHFPGDGSRMPNFNLTDKEIDEITSYFQNQQVLIDQYKPKKLSPFAMQKAKGRHPIGRSNH